MAFQEVSTKIIKMHEEKFIDRPLTAYYLGSKKSSKFENSRIHKFKKKTDGSHLAVYGTGSLNYLMGEVAEGTLVRITYKGTEKMDTKFGKGKDVNIFKVEADHEDVMTGKELISSQSAANYDDSEDEEESSFDSPQASGAVPKQKEEDDLPF